MREKKPASFWRILMEGRPWDSNSQQGMCLNYLQTVPLQTEKNEAKANVSKGYFPLTNTGVAECV